MHNHTVKIGLLGVGTVGTGVIRLLRTQSDLLRQRSALVYQLKSAVDLDWSRARDVDLDGIRTGSDPGLVLEDPEIDIVVETIGGIEPAATYIAKALRQRKHVVTANKALVASRGRELFRLARENGVDLLFEASVGGGIPIIKGLREGLVANRIRSIFGILNGTTNFILTKMSQEGLNFDEALAQAQRLGFAEADPTLDVSGGDAAHKLTILASIAASASVDLSHVYTEGITGITKIDVDFAKSFGFEIKLLAICRQLDGRYDLRVHPTLIPRDHLLAAVNNELNAVFVQGDFVGDTMFYGPGAGERPTASAIVSDLVDLSRDLLLNEGERFCRRTIDPAVDVQLLPLSEISSRFYLRFYTLDAPGILTKIAGALADNCISISSVVQLERHERDNYVPLVILTHQASEKAMDRALAAIREFGFVRDDMLRLRLF
ncbi:MAG: homoserine dehydrogenase [Bacteroidota bacterium]